MKLQQYLARAGIASRRKAEELILAGRVSVNGNPATLGMRVDPDDQVLFDGKPVLGAESFVYFAFHKPRGVLSTVRDDRGRKTVIDFYPGKKRIFPIGRLDYASRGLLLLTNDGDFAQLFVHPRFGLDKDYRVVLHKQLTKEDIRILTSGIELEGYRTKSIEIKELGKNTYLFTLIEGRNRQIRRMVESRGKEVMDLLRLRVGPFSLNHLEEGRMEALPVKKVEELKRALGS